MTEHTPGPWREGRDWYIIENGYGFAVGSAASVHIGKEQCRANARLMAAAPDLLEACRLALPVVEEVAATHAGSPMGAEAKVRANTIRAAIRKATGDTS